MIPGSRNEFLLNPYGLLFQEVTLPPREVCEYAARRHWAAYKDEPFGQLDWDALVRRLDVEDVSYRT